MVDMKRWYRENIKWRFGKRPTVNITGLQPIEDGTIHAENTQIIVRSDRPIAQFSESLFKRN